MTKRMERVRHRRPWRTRPESSQRSSSLCFSSSSSKSASSSTATPQSPSLSRPSSPAPTWIFLASCMLWLHLSCRQVHVLHAFQPNPRIRRPISPSVTSDTGTFTTSTTLFTSSPTIPPSITKSPLPSPRRPTVYSTATTTSINNRPPSSTKSSSLSSARPTDADNRSRARKKMTPMPVTGYDARAIEEYYDARPLQVGWRLNSLGLPLLAWYARLLLDKANGVLDKPEVQRMQGRELRQVFVRSKSVALIKSGQALSLRPDLIKNRVWAEELGKLVDAVGSFSDMEAMKIIQVEFKDLYPRMQSAKGMWQESFDKRRKSLPGGRRKIEKVVMNDPVLSLFEFSNDHQAVASASIGQVYKAKIRRGPQLEAAIGKELAAKWGGKIVAIKVQRPDVASSASLDMYLLRRTATWLSKMRGGNLPGIADQFGVQLFGELDYVREANNCERFRELYGDWENVMVPDVCTALTRKKVLVMEWVEGEKGPWPGEEGIQMVRIGLKCSVDQLMTTGLFHADPHRGNLLKTPDGRLAFIDFGMMTDIDEEDRYGLFGLCIGLQSKDLPLVTENLLKLGFLDDTTQLDQLIPRLRSALKNSTGGSGKASDVNFARLQAELDAISRENVLQFSTPPFFTVIIRSLTILEGVALSVDPRFRLVRGSYPYVLRQLLIPEEDGRTPVALQKLLVRLLTVNGDGKEIEWERLRDLLRLAQKARSKYNPADDEARDGDSSTLSRQTIDLFFKFLTSKTGQFLKRPIVHELAEAIDGMASMGEANLFRVTNGLIPALPGMNGPVNRRVMSEMSMMLDTFRSALAVDTGAGAAGSMGQARIQAMRQLLDEVASLLADERLRGDAEPLLQEIFNVVQMVAVEVLEIRGSRAMRSILQLGR